jgi:hypothetical protein
MHLLGQEAVVFTVLTPQTLSGAGATNATNNINLSTYQGRAGALIVSVGGTAGTTPTLAITEQESNDNGSTDLYTATGNTVIGTSGSSGLTQFPTTSISANGDYWLDIDFQYRKNWQKFIFTVAGTSPVFIVSAKLILYRLSHVPENAASNYSASGFVPTTLLGYSNI